MVQIAGFAFVCAPVVGAGIIVCSAGGAIVGAFSWAKDKMLDICISDGCYHDRNSGNCQKRDRYVPRCLWVHSMRAGVI